MFKRKALITGASSGIGAATAELFAQQGYDLILLARRFDKLAEVSKHCQALNPQVEVKYISIDLLDRKQIDQFLINNDADLKTVNVLVNSAGLARGVEKFQNSNHEDNALMIDTNINSLFYITQKILPYFVKNNSGHVVNLGSVAGLWSYSGGAVYCATKAAIKAFSESLRLDLMGTKIRVTNIEPGMVNTEFSTVRFQDKAKADATYAGMTPLSGRDIADTILWSVQRPDHVNIQELIIFPTDQAGVGHVNRK